MYSQSTLVHANKQDRGAHLGKWQSWRRVKMTMVSQETDWIWAFWAFFSQGKGVKSRLQCWGCMCPAPRAVTKKYGALSLFLSPTHTHTHTHTSFLSLHLPVFSPFLIISSIIKSGEKLIIFGSQCPYRCSFWHNTRGVQTKSICRDSNLLIPLANCENNHFKITPRKIWFYIFTFKLLELTTQNDPFMILCSCIIKEQGVITVGWFHYLMQHFNCHTGHFSQAVTKLGSTWPDAGTVSDFIISPSLAGLALICTMNTFTLGWLELITSANNAWDTT